MPAYPYPGTEESSWFPALASTFLAVALVLCDQAQTILPDDFFSHALSCGILAMTFFCMYILLKSSFSRRKVVKHPVSHSNVSERQDGADGWWQRLSGKPLRRRQASSRASRTLSRSERYLRLLEEQTEGSQAAKCCVDFRKTKFAVDGKDPFDKQCRLEPSFRPVATASNIVVFSSSRGFMKPKTSRVLGRSENQCRPKSVVEVPWFPDTARCLPTHACPVLLLWSQAGT
eukprot:s1379_g3.t2